MRKRQFTIVFKIQELLVLIIFNAHPRKSSSAFIFVSFVH